MSSQHRAAAYCGCCEGTDTVTPREIFNRPGLPDLRWRVGEHADFLETMRSRIARVSVDVESGGIGPHGRPRKARLFPLRNLRTRDDDDPTIALLHLWSVVGDILSFYTERIAAEGYLRTATELRSLNELARLVGYRRRPGVAASVYLAFTADDAWTKPLVIPTGARVQSSPEPGEPPVFFETDAALPARPQWNVLIPRQTRPTHMPQFKADDAVRLYLNGTATRLTPSTGLLLEHKGSKTMRMVRAAKEDFDRKRTEVELVVVTPPKGTVLETGGPPAEVDLDVLLAQLERPPSVPPASPARLGQSPMTAFGPGSTAVDGLILGFHPDAAATFTRARANAAVSPDPELRSVSALRVKPSVYGHQAAPPPPLPPITGGVVGAQLAQTDWFFEYGSIDPEIRRRILDLDTTYDSILPNTSVVVDRPNAGRLITQIEKVEVVSRTSYNAPAKVTRLVLEDPWLPDLVPNDPLRLSQVRATQIFAAPEVLVVAEEPVDDPVCDSEIELDRQIDGLEPGRWIIVTGERAVSTPPAGASGPSPEIEGEQFSVAGVAVSELTMLSGVRQNTLWTDHKGRIWSPSVFEPGSNVFIAASEETSGKGPSRLPGDLTHTFLRLATPLAYCYKRDTVKIYANVAHATHGETHEEPLGGGDGTKIFQTFGLKSDPLTYVSAPSVTGVESSLKVYVNDVRWHEAENLLDLGPADRGYLTFADHADKTTVTFGDGRNGARPPTGVENIRSVYRSGIGRAGNVRATQLSNLVAKTEGLRGVVNPQRASGGADPEGLESTRVRAPLAVAALDRLLGTPDYADFAKLFAGIGKASAARLPGRHGHVVHVTVAGEDDIPIDATSDLHRNLLEALRRFGDPHLPVRLARRELLALIIGAGVRIHPDHLWDIVRPALEASLKERFGFEHRELAQDAYAAEAVAAMQAVPGVDFVDLNLFDAVSEKTPASDLAALGLTLSGVRDRIAALPDRVGAGAAEPLAAQLVILPANLPTAVMLTEIPHE